MNEKFEIPESGWAYNNKRPKELKLDKGKLNYNIVPTVKSNQKMLLENKGQVLPREIAGIMNRSLANSRSRTQPNTTSAAF